MGHSNKRYLDLIQTLGEAGWLRHSFSIRSENELFCNVPHSTCKELSSLGSFYKFSLIKLTILLTLTVAPILHCVNYKTKN